MEIAISGPLEDFVKQAVREGRYASESEVVNQSLRMLQENERKLAGLRAMVDLSIKEGGLITADEMEADLEEQCEQLHSEGIPW